MKLPKKIQILNSSRGAEPLLRFDNWEGYDTRRQLLNLVHKVNQVIDYLRLVPEIRNETPMLTQIEGGEVVHQHDWIEHARLGNILILECRDCGETLQKLAT